MRFKNLFFHIHYCNRRLNEPARHPRKITRTLQHHELAFFTGGKGRLMIGKKSYPIRDGMLVYICPDVLHTLELDTVDDTDEPIRVLTVHFSYASVNFGCDKWEINDEAQMLPFLFAQELKDYYQIDDIFKKLVGSWYAKRPGYEFVSKTFLQQLLIAIMQNIKKQDRNDSASLKVEKMIDYMHQKINGQVTLAELSEMTQLSPSYLSRIFKETTGYSIISYFNKIKIDKAKEMIVEGNKKVKEVARTLGFADEFYFSRIFKKTEGISPSEFYGKNVHGL